jgi:hypothetical protein
MCMHNEEGHRPEMPFGGRVRELTGRPRSCSGRQPTVSANLGESFSVARSSPTPTVVQCGCGPGQTRAAQPALEGTAGVLRRRAFGGTRVSRRGADRRFRVRLPTARRAFCLAVGRTIWVLSIYARVLARIAYTTPARIGIRYALSARRLSSAVKKLGQTTRRRLASASSRRTSTWRVRLRAAHHQGSARGLRCTTPTMSCLGRARNCG